MSQANKTIEFLADRVNDISVAAKEAAEALRVANVDDPGSMRMVVVKMNILEDKIAIIHAIHDATAGLSDGGVE